MDCRMAGPLFFVCSPPYCWGAMEAVCKLYAAMVIGSQFGQHRIIGSVVAYYLCGIAETILLLAVALPILFPLGK